HAEGVGAFYSPIGRGDGYVYFAANNKVFALSIAGGTAKEVGPAFGQRQLVHAGKLYGFAAGNGAGTAKLLSAPLTDLTTTATLAESLAEPQYFVADDAGVYF